MNHITLIDDSTFKIFVSSIDTRGYLLGFKDTVSQMHIKINHYRLTTLILGLAESGSDSVFAFNPFSIAKLLINGIFRVLVPKDQQMFIDTNFNIVKASKQHSCHSNILF